MVLRHGNLLTQHFPKKKKKKKAELHHFDAGSKPRRGEVRFVFPLSTLAHCRCAFVNPSPLGKKKKRSRE